MHVKGVIFDLDGTIINSLRCIIRCLNEALRKLGAKNFYTIKDSKRLILMDFEDIVYDKLHTMDYNIVRTFSEIYYQIHEQTFTKDTKIVDGILDVLKEIKKLKLKMGIVTLRSKRSATLVVNHFGLAKFLDVVITSDDVRNYKPHPEGIIKACELLNLEPRHAIFVGDMYVDIIAGKRAGCVTVAVTWGNQSENELSKYNPNFIVNTPEELFKLTLFLSYNESLTQNDTKVFISERS